MNLLRTSWRFTGGIFFPGRKPLSRQPHQNHLRRIISHKLARFPGSGPQSVVNRNGGELTCSTKGQAEDSCQRGPVDSPLVPQHRRHVQEWAQLFANATVLPRAAAGLTRALQNGQPGLLATALLLHPKDMQPSFVFFHVLDIVLNLLLQIWGPDRESSSARAHSLRRPHAQTCCLLALYKQKQRPSLPPGGQAGHGGGSTVSREAAPPTSPKDQPRKFL